MPRPFKISFSFILLTLLPLILVSVGCTLSDLSTDKSLFRGLEGVAAAEAWSDELVVAGSALAFTFDASF